MKTVRELKKGEWFCRKPIEEPKEHQVLIRGEYVPGLKKYECQYWSDMNRFTYIKGDAPAYTEFTF